MGYLATDWGAIDLYVEHGIDDAEVVQNLALPEPEHVDDIQEDVEVEDDPGVGTQEDNDHGVVSQADGDSNLETSPQDEADFVEAECRNAENNNEESRRARAKVDNENVGLGEKDDVQSAYYDCEYPLSYQSEKEEVEASFEHITNAATSRFKYPSYNPNVESVDLEVGILYDDGKQFKKAMINYVVYSTRNIHFVRNELSICVEYNAEIFA
nr:uncharacterized protein LOC109164765 [Ipomoea batatas]